MPLFTIKDVRYHVEVQGHGTPIMLLHGFTGSADNWAPLISALQDRFQLIAVDLLGHGQTTAPLDPSRYRIEDAAADLASLITLLGLGKTHLVGYSMGGRLALYIACYYPHLIHSLILESGSPGLVTETEQQARRVSDEALANWIEQNGISKFVDYWEALPLFVTQRHLPETVRRTMHEQRLRNTPHGLASSLRGMGTGVQPSLWELLGLIALPVLLVVGAHDAKFTEIARQMHVRISGSALVTVPDVGHTVHLELPTAMINLLTGFVGSVATAS